MTDTNDTRKRLRLRRLTSFSLRTALIAITVLAVWLGLHMNSVRKQRASIETVHRLGGSVHYDYEVTENLQLVTNAESTVPAWLLNRLGRDHFHAAVCVILMTSGQLDDALGEPSGTGAYLSGFPHLECLLICESHATDEALEHVGELKHLQEFGMWKTSDVTDQGLTHLRNLKEIEYVTLGGSQITDECLRSFTQMPKLHNLALNGPRFTEHALQYVREMGSLRDLSIEFGGGTITAEGIRHLQALPQLNKLSLLNSHLEEDALRQLAELKHLKALSLSRRQIADAEWLQERLPNCKIRVL